MATQLNKPVSRVVQMSDKIGAIGNVVVTINHKGLALRGKGKQREFQIPWEKLSSIVERPITMPAKYNSNPIGWLIENSKASTTL